MKRLQSARAGLRLGIVAVVLAQLSLTACLIGREAATGSSNPHAAPPTPTITASPGTLEWYLAQVPTFPPAPTPVKVKVPDSKKAVVWSSVPTDQRVAFITIDDGQYQDQLWVDFIRTAKIPVTSFLTYYFVWHSGDYFLRIHPGGRGIHEHGKTHDALTKFSYQEQKKVICQADEWLGNLYSPRPRLFRPPYGSYNDGTLSAAGDCGHKLAMMWTHELKDGRLTARPERPLQPGDVILLHYRDTLPRDLIVALQAIRQAGLVPAALDDYIDLDG